MLRLRISTSDEACQVLGVLQLLHEWTNQPISWGGYLPPPGQCFSGSTTANWPSLQRAYTAPGVVQLYCQVLKRSHTGPGASTITMPRLRLTSWQVTSQVHLAQTVKMWLPYSGLLPGPRTATSIPAATLIPQHTPGHRSWPCNFQWRSVCGTGNRPSIRVDCLRDGQTATRTLTPAMSVKGPTQRELPLCIGFRGLL